MASDTVTIELPATVYAELETLANEERIEPADVIARLLDAARQQYQSDSPARAFRRILERATDLGVGDLAEQHDHYLYGVDKR